jgi:hypothetical protein
MSRAVAVSGGLPFQSVFSIFILPAM